MAFESYFENFEYYSGRGKGITLFQAERIHIDLFCNSLSALQPHFITIILSDASDHAISNLIQGNPKFIVIFQDIGIESLLLKADSLINKLIWPAYYKNIPIAIFDIHQKVFYDYQIQSGLIHSEKAKIINQLLIEQFILISDLVNFQIDLNYINDTVETVLLTPIEKIMQSGLVEANLPFKAQARINNYYADFLVSQGETRVVVECDGRDFHNPFRDQLRDQQLNQLGYRVLRFTGSEIYHDIRSCIEKISASLNEGLAIRNYEIDNNLDESQMQAIRQITGPIRVLAPAGSGKTKTLINRIAELINKGIQPHKILALAFNKKAAAEMRDRLFNKGIIVSNNLHSDGVSVRTFHSFGYELIKEYLHWNYNEENERQMPKRFMRQIIESKRLMAPFNAIQSYRIPDAIDQCLEALRKSKMELIPAAELTFEIEANQFPFEGILNEFLTHQYQNQLVSFDDMIYIAVRILLDNKYVRNSLQSKFEYVLIDEFQDLNEAQLLMMQIISLPKNNIFIVGDDDQMIYGWRGANIRHIIDFKERYGVFSDNTLSTNYRSSKKIVHHSSWLIKHNLNRIDKDINPRSGAIPGQFKVEVCNNIYEQAIKAAEWLLNLHTENHNSWSDFAVLFRYHDFNYAIALALDAEEVPHTPVNGQRLFHTNPGRDIYAYLTVIIHPNDAKADDFSRILKRPNKYIQNSIIEQITDWAAFQNLAEHFIEQWRIEKVTQIINHINAIQNNLPNLTAQELVSTVYEIFGFRDFYHDIHNVNADLDKAPDEILLDVIISVARFSNSIDEFYMKIYQAIHDENLTDIDHQEEGHEAVILSSIHSSKGKEFKNVIYFNHIKSMYELNEAEIEEERRVSYVGMTRAIENILITSQKSSYSPFIKEAALNPLFSESSIQQINDQLSRQRTQLQQNSVHKSELEREKTQLFDEFPELNGEPLRIQLDPLINPIDDKINHLKQRLKSLKIPPSGFLAILRKKINKSRIDGINKKLHKLNDRIKKIRDTEIYNRENLVTTARMRLGRMVDEEIPLINQEIETNKNRIEELETELGFRTLLVS